MTRLLILISLLALTQSGCGVLVGTVVDTGIGVATYPVKEYVALGAYKVDNPSNDAWRPLTPPKPDRGEAIVGIAISGGGSRSAYFLAAVLERLSKIPIRPGSETSILDEVDYISSVSGGSLASGYYCLKGFEPGVKRDEAFFAEFKEEMAKNFEMRSLGRLALGYWVLDLFTYYDRGDLIAAVWDSNFFNDATFRDLAENEARGAPTLIVNGTCVSNGLKFVFSTAPDERFARSAFFQDLADRGLISFGVSKDYRSFQTFGFQSLNSDIGRYPLSKAVAASASVPNLLGPISLEAKEPTGREELVNLPAGYILNVTDGGIYDNYGVETLTQIITADLDERPGMPARIIVVDGSGFFSRDLSGVGDAFSVAYFSERTLSISWLRSKAYMEYVLRRVKFFRNEQGHLPYRNLDFNLVSLYDVLPSQERETYYPVTVEDKAIKAFLRPDVTATDFLKKLTTIGTRFKIEDEDRSRVEEAALLSAERMRGRFLR